MFVDLGRTTDVRIICYFICVMQLCSPIDINSFMFGSESQQAASAMLGAPSVLQFGIKHIYKI